MKRFVLPVLLIVALIAAAGFVAQTALAIDDTSTITVTVPQYISIEGLIGISVNVTFSGAGPATGSGSNTDDFTVEANVNTGISAAVTTQPTWGDVGTYLSTSVTPISGTSGSTSATLTATVTGVPLTVSPTDYSGVITVTVIAS